MTLIEKYKTVKMSKDSKALFSNFSYLTLLQIAGYIFPLITIPYLSRVIGANGLGRIAFGAAVITWFMSISTWGFNFTATRDAARCRDDLSKLSTIFSNVFWARIVLSILCFLCLLILICIIPSFWENNLVLFITFISIPANILFPEWLFQALERMKYITILSLLSKLIFSLAIFIFIKSPNDYYLEPLLSSLGSLVAGAISLYFVIYRWNIKLFKPSWVNIKSTISGGMDVFINNFMPNLYNSMSFVLLGAFHGNAATGILSAGDKCLSICNQFMNILARTFFPFLSRHGEKHKIYARLTIVVAFLFAAILYVASPFLIRILFTSEFLDAIVVSKILAISLVFLAINNVFGTNFLILKGYEKPLRNITIVCSVIGFISSVIFIYIGGYYGAAVTITLVRGITSLSIMSYAFRIKK